MRPKERVIYDEPQPCPYLPDRSARLPIRWPEQRLSRAQFDQRLAQGDRRTGSFLYRPHCPGCQACEAIRLPVNDFQPRATQRRTLRRGDELLRLEIGEPQATLEQVALYNRHKQQRNLSQAEDVHQETLASYGTFLVDTCCDTEEFRYYHGDQLVAVSIVDWGESSLSAVYTYFEPHFPGLSLGAYAILRQVKLCRERRLSWLYLGYYVANCSHMNYKGLYCPHERLIAGEWQRFTEPPPRAGLEEGPGPIGR